MVLLRQPPDHVVAGVRYQKLAGRCQRNSARPVELCCQRRSTVSAVTRRRARNRFNRASGGQNLSNRIVAGVGYVNVAVRSHGHARRRVQQRGRCRVAVAQVTGGQTDRVVARIRNIEIVGAVDTQLRWRVQLRGGRDRSIGTGARRAGSRERRNRTAGNGPYPVVQRIRYVDYIVRIDRDSFGIVKLRRRRSRPIPAERAIPIRSREQRNRPRNVDLPDNAVGAVRDISISRRIGRHTRRGVQGGSRSGRTIPQRTGETDPRKCL